MTTTPPPARRQPVPRSGRQLPRYLLTRVVVDRLEEAMIAADLTLPQMLVVCQTVAPEAFADCPPPARTAARPGAGKVPVLALRAARHEALFRPDESRLDDPVDDEASVRE